jgi:predicted nucleotidyltransferase
MERSRRDGSPEAAIAAAVRAESAVLAAYLFGSRARGEERASSDLDVALVLTRGAELGHLDRERIRSTIARATGLSVDLSVLTNETPVLAFEVIDGGRRVFTRDEEAADVAEERLLQIYLDTNYMRRVQNHYLLGRPL